MSDYNIEKEIQSFLNQLKKEKKFISQNDILEIEDHLRCRIESCYQDGTSLEKSIQTVLKDFGSPETILNEHQKIYKNDKLGQIRNFASHYFEARTVQKIFIPFMFFSVAIAFFLTITHYQFEVMSHIKPLLFFITTTIFLSFLPLAFSWSQQKPTALIKEFLKNGSQNSIFIGIWGFTAGIISMLNQEAQFEHAIQYFSFSSYCLLYGILTKTLFFDPLQKSFKSPSQFTSHQEKTQTPWISSIISIAVLTISLYSLDEIFVFFDPLSLASIGFISITPIFSEIGLNLKKIKMFLELKKTNDFNSSYVFKNMSLYALFTGLIMTIFGIISAMTHAEKIEYIPLGLAVALLPSLYGLMGYYFWNSMRVLTKSHHRESQKASII